MAPTNEVQLVTVTGTVERIQLQDINKAQGQYTYNIDVFVGDAKFEPAPEGTPTMPVRVRLVKTRWDKMSADEQGSLSSAGPASQFEPEAFRGYSVGEATSIRVRFSSPDLAHIVE